MSHNRKHFVDAMMRAMTNAFLVGYHEERTEEDPPDPLEPEMTRNVIR